MPIKGKERNGSKWKIGVVERLIQGQDGVIRGAQLKAGRTHTETTAAAYHWKKFCLILCILRYLW